MLKELRIKAGLTLRQVADKAGMARQTISNAEKNPESVHPNTKSTGK